MTSQGLKLISDEKKLNIWTAFLYFQKGATLIYAGQEAQDSNTPSLFDIDKVNWSGMKEQFVEYMKTLATIKKKEIMSKGYYNVDVDNEKDVIVASYKMGDKKLIGIFNVKLEEGFVKVEVEDGTYKNLIDKVDVVVKNGQIELKDKAIIIEA